MKQKMGVDEGRAARRGGVRGGQLVAAGQAVACARATYFSAGLEVTLSIRRASVDPLVGQSSTGC